MNVMRQAEVESSRVLPRNAACFCGSGRRHKHCCGAAATTGADLLETEAHQSRSRPKFAALEHHLAGRLGEAEASYRKALETDANDPDVLHMLGMVLYARGNFGEALSLVRKAGELSHWTLPAILHNLGLVLGSRLAGKDAGKAAQWRIAYDAWLPTRQARWNPVRPLVSVVIPSHNHARYIRAALDSVYRQTYRNLELIVIDDGSDDGSPRVIRDNLRASPFPSRFVARDNRGAAATINEGVLLSNGECINVLDSDDCFETNRIAGMVDAVAAIGAEWGFSSVACIDDSGATLKGTADPRAAWITAAAHHIRQSDTIGSALLGESNVSISTGNLFFTRQLFDLLHGFENFRYNHDWDFCLRALWQSEPCFVPQPLYKYRSHPDNTIRENADATRSEAHRVLNNYHSIAIVEQPANPFAPSRHTLGLRYFSDHLTLGGGDSFSTDTLIDLARELETRDAAHAGEHEDLLPGGLNIVGYFRGEFGLGVSVRALARVCMANDIPVCLADADLRLGSRQAERSMDAHLSDRMRFRTTLIYMNPDQLNAVRDRLGRNRLRNQYQIGFWYWEMEHLPRKWLEAFDLVDEIWVASDFVAAAVVRSTDKPVVKIPHSICVRVTRKYDRREFGLPEKAFLFLFSFDFNSYAARKNPAATIRAFREAFPSKRDDVGLVLKYTHGHKHPEELAALEALIASDPRIVGLDGLLERDALHGLQSVCNAYVSLHRSEGLGLGMAECMALGVPVIATAYSGNLEFMTDSNSCLVDYDLIPVLPGEYIDHEDHWYWAEADIDHAAYFMRKVYKDSQFRTSIALRGKHDIEVRFNEAITAAAVRKRISELQGVYL